MLEHLNQLGLNLEQNPNIGMPPPGHQNVAIRWIIHLTADGSVAKPATRTTNGDEKRERAEQFVAPTIMRTSGARAKPFADNSEYTLGVGSLEVNAALVAERRSAYLVAIEDCYAATRHAPVRAVLQFLKDPDVGGLQLPEDFNPTELLTFEVNGSLVIADLVIREYWSHAVWHVNSTAASLATDVVGECAITGETGVLMQREPVRIKGIPGSLQNNAGLITANESSFQSYGLTASQGASVLPQQAERYANALNYLLSNKDTNLRLHDVVYVFWNADGTPGIPVTQLLSNPAEGILNLAAQLTGETPAEPTDDPAQISSAINTIWAGGTTIPTPSDTIYGLALSANMSRVVVRSEITSTIPALLKQLKNYYDAQDIVTTRGANGSPLGVYALAASLYPAATPGRRAPDLAKLVVTSLVDHALKGSRLPSQSLLQQLAIRNQVEARVTRPRAALTKLVLSSMGKDISTMTSLNPDHPSRGYQLGRLLAIFSSIQYDALGNVNRGVVDTYYGALSSNPSAVLGRLTLLSRQHLAKLRNAKYDAFVANERKLRDVFERIGDAPTSLNAYEKSMFALGYYHEDAAKWAAIDAHKAAKAAEAETKPKSKTSTKKEAR